MSANFRAHLFLLTVNIIYGANYIIAKGLMPEKIAPSGFIMLRVTGAVILFWTVFLIFKPSSEAGTDKSMIGRGTFAVRKSDLLRLFACGLFGVATNQLFFFNGLSLTSPINAAIIMTSNPILVLIISAIILKEAVNIKRVSGVILGAIGAVTLIMLSKNDVSGFSSPLGDLFILVNSTSYAVYLVLVKPLMQRYHPLAVISWVFLFGFAMVIPFGWTQLSEVQWSSFSNWDLFSAFYVVVATTFLAYLLNITALRTVAPTVASSYIYLQPVVAGISAWIFSFYLSEDYTSDFSILKLICALLIFTGVYLVSRPVLKSIKP